MCKAHDPGADKVCTDCEGELYLQEAKVGKVKGAIQSIGVAVGSAGGAVAAFVVGGWASMVIAAAMGAGLTMMTAMSTGKESTSKRRRRKFLRERNPKYESAIDEQVPPKK